MAKEGIIQNIKNSMFGGAKSNSGTEKKDVFSAKGAQDNIRNNRKKKEAIMKDLFPN